VGRRKGHWRATLFSYGQSYVRGKVDGYHIVVKAQDGTDSGRYIDIKLDDGSVSNLMSSMTKHMERDHSNDAEPVEGDNEEGDSE
jgi:hypothetical protein